ncbi:MAG: sigma-70 family RNA polymerase sigma factor [Abditibacteriales bacterium]|nr:sigma-70 family RNA polymerase sigma factor [Abditibacteriales bacterium]MDW8366545.1 sigma-70 family RNA polymerase sigma factor [Abditibacteriales bacterium]
MVEKEPLSFEDVVEKYHQKVFNLVYRYLNDYDEAQDLTQDTFVRAYQSWTTFRGESQVYTWLYRIALNLCHNRLKQLRRRQRVEVESLDQPVEGESEDIVREVPDLSLAPERLVENKELQQVIRRAIRQLPEDYKQVIILRDIEGFSYSDIAKMTGSSLEAIKSRLFRARTALRDLLRPYLSGEDSRRPPAPQEETSNFAAADEMPPKRRRTAWRKFNYRKVPSL